MKTLRLKLTALLVLTGIIPMAFSQSPPDTVSIEELVVTGSRVEISRKNMPVNIVVFSKEELNEMGSSTALSAISGRSAGIFVTERGMTGFNVGSSSAGQISIRGVSGEPNSRVLVLVDGSPQFMGIFGHPLPNSYVASDLEKVEVIKGPASILYGSNAMGGAINFITKRPAKEGLSGELTAAYGSFNTLKYAANLGFQKNKLSMLVSFNHDNTDGHRDSSDFKINNVFVKAGYAVSEHISVQADFSYADFHNQDPGPEFGLSAFTADIKRGKGSIALNTKYDRMEGGLNAFYNFGNNSLSDGWRSDDSNLGVTLFEGIKLFQGNLLTVGVDYMQYGGKGNSSFPANDNQDKVLSVNEVAGFLVARQNIQKLDLSAGFRVENNSDFGTEFVPQAGIAYNLNMNTSIKASASKGYRNPLVMETYLFLPNPDLKPEKMLNYELGLDQSLFNKKLNAQLSLFWLEGSNAIEVVPDPDPPYVKRANTGSFTHKGIEIETRMHLTKSLVTELNYSYLNMKAPRLGAPEHQLFAGVNYKMDNLTLALQGIYIGGLYSQLESAFPPATEETESYFLLNASARYKLVKWAELFVAGKNLLDKDYAITFGYPMPGINVLAGITVKF